MRKDDFSKLDNILSRSSATDSERKEILRLLKFMNVSYVIRLVEILELHGQFVDLFVDNWREKRLIFQNDDPKEWRKIVEMEKQYLNSLQQQNL